MPLSWIATIGFYILPNAIVIVSNNCIFKNSNCRCHAFDVFKIPDYVKIIIIVFNIETYLKYLLFDKLFELMDSNIFVILS